MAWLGTYAKRREITVDYSGKVTSALTDFPLCLILDASAGLSSEDVTDIFSDLGASFAKLSITSSDETTELQIDVDLWDHTNNKAVLHVLAPSVSSSAATTFYIYWDASQSDNSKISVANTAVWDANFIGVYHFRDDPSAGTLTCANGANNMAMAGSMSAGQLVDGKIAKAWNFDGSNDYTDLADPWYTDRLTLEAVINADTTAKIDTIITRRNTPGVNASTTQQEFSFDKTAAGKSNFYVYNTAGSAIVSITGATTLTAGTDFYAAAYTGGASTTGDTGIWVNAASDATPVNRNSDTIRNGSSRLQIGARTASDDTRYFDGKISEVRISNIRRADAWLLATYHTLWDTLLTYGSTATYSLAVAGTRLNYGATGGVMVVASGTKAAVRNALSFDTAPRVLYEPAGTIVSWSGGFPFSSTGSLVTDASGAIVYYVNGLPYTAAGLAVVVDGGTFRNYVREWPISTTGKVMLSTT
jgi:hypothetical protein